MTDWAIADADPAVYRVVLGLPAGRWYAALVQANSMAEAVATVRHSARLPDAPYVFGGRTSTLLPARTLQGEVVIPAGWEGKA